MPSLAPSFARLPPPAYLHADQLESRKKIAWHLGISLRTLQRYAASGNAPRAVYLVWFESRWGMATSARSRGGLLNKRVGVLLDAELGHDKGLPDSKSRTEISFGRNDGN